LKNLIKNYLFLFLIAGLVIALDQYTKSLVRTSLGIGEMWAPWPWLMPYARIVHWWNTGIAFGMFQELGSLFKVLPVLISLVLLYYFPRIPANVHLLRIGMGMQLGGAVGNLIDRLTVGHVTDFISVGNLPVINLADASITVGVAILLLGVWLQERRQKKDSEPLAAAGG